MKSHLKRWWIAGILLMLPVSIGWANHKIIGKVVDGNSYLPLSSTLIFLEGTTFWATADSLGLFTLNAPDNGEFQLSASYTGYLNKKIPVNLAEYKGDTIKFILMRIQNTLPEVVISEKRSKIRQSYINKFWKAFLGEDKDGKSNMKVLNEDVVNFHYDEQNRLLTVNASERIEVENHYLGYRILFDLSEFTHDYRARRSNTVGSSFFTELTPIDEKEAKKWTENRKKAFKGSPLHFFRTLYKGTSDEEGFQLYPVTTDSIIFAQNKAEMIAPKKRKKEEAPDLVFYFNWTRTLLVSRLPVSSREYTSPQVTKTREVNLPLDLFVVYSKSQPEFMYDYYKKGITHKKKTWLDIFEEEMKPTRQFYLYIRPWGLSFFENGTYFPSGSITTNTVQMYGLKYMMPYNYEEKE